MRRLTTVLLFAVLNSVSCNLPHENGESTLTAEPHIHVQMVIEGQQAIEKARVRIGEYTTVAGGIAGKGASTHLFFDHPLTPSADVIYRLPGSKNEKTLQVDLPPLPKKTLSDVTLIFIINADTGTARVELHEGITSK